jgi:hypothetical protein
VHVETVLPSDADILPWTQHGFSKSLVHEIFPLDNMIVLDHYLHNSSLKSRKDYCFTRRTKFTTDFLPLAQRKQRVMFTEAELLAIDERWRARLAENVKMAAQKESPVKAGQGDSDGEDSSEEEEEAEGEEEDSEEAGSEEGSEQVESGKAESDEEGSEVDESEEEQSDEAEDASEEEGEEEDVPTVKVEVDLGVVDQDDNKESIEPDSEGGKDGNDFGEVAVNTPPVKESPVQQSPQAKQSPIKQSPPAKQSPVESPENMSVSQEAMVQALPQTMKKTAPRRNVTSGWKPSLRA